ncbi:MAG: 6-bladed beta-propeller [Salinibacter sp.]|uniref:6-bladed beta-propeller n=1 Tax=Salinibacter sp. TaxID=2065818 RepID=UPI0035D51FB1
MTSSFRALILLAVVALLGAGCQPSAPEAPSYQFVQAWGTQGDAPGEFFHPVGITIARGRVYVSDTGNNRIQVFDTTGTVLRSFDASNILSGPMQRPMHLEATAHEKSPVTHLVVPEYGHDHLHLFGRKGGSQSTIGSTGSGSGQFDAPAGVAIGTAGQVYVADFYNHRVQLLQPGTGQVRQWGTSDTSGSAPGQFTYPTDVTLLPDGSLVVADAYNHRIQRFGPEGNHQWTVPPNTTQPGSTKTRFNVATAVETGPQGRIFVADYYNHRIKIFSAEGKRLAMFGEQGSGEGQFVRPIDVAFDASGTLYVVDFGNNRIQVFAPES